MQATVDQKLPNHVAELEKIFGKAPRWDWPGLLILPTLHVLALFAIPYFTWERLGWTLALLFVVTPIGVNLTFHRVLSHRSLKLPQWLEYAGATLGALVAGGPPLLWAASHRAHHKHSDSVRDPHNSRVGFWYAHIGHLFRGKSQAEVDSWLKMAPDLRDDRYYQFLDRTWILLAASTLIPLYFIGGIGHVLWLGIVRVVLMLNVTWFVNSACHWWGYRNYASNDSSTNCWWAAALTAGEGWHNNHHAQPYSASNHHRWWEFDFTWGIIRMLEMVGLATQVRRPKTELMIGKRTAPSTSVTPPTSDTLTEVTPETENTDLLLSVAETQNAEATV